MAAWMKKCLKGLRKAQRSRDGYAAVGAIGEGAVDDEDRVAARFCCCF